ncbi:hypothetical protein LR48_Vigan10g219800 [Vigna angularis]|uniref:Uncharacterized protein n=1 Tax=Phaseolus angularis TaxID=3914 RepID=A0A0L9VMJ9_PHAAN|nr:hypothetical protein LR48_Vigan10g219800 [Vigna angularis]
MTTPTEDDIPSPNEAKGKKGIMIMKKIVRARSEGQKLELTFNVDTCCKTFVLRKAELLLRSFRTSLAHKYLKDDKGDYLENPPIQPPAKYASIVSEDIWR